MNALTEPFTKFGCTNFSYKIKDGTVISGRTMDLYTRLFTHVIPFNKDEEWQSEAPNGNKGFSWISKYGFIGFSGLGKPNLADGMNTEGLTAAILMLEATRYQEVPFDKETGALAVHDLCAYVLSTCRTTREVKEALKVVYVWRNQLDQYLNYPLCHFAFNDAFGDRLVVEYIDGQPKFYDTDNNIGVLTNDPVLSTHQEMLPQYCGLTNKIPSNLVINGYSVSNKSSIGTGCFGLSWDSSPAMRLARIAISMLFMDVNSIETSEKGEIAAWHLLKKVDVFKKEVFFPVLDTFIKSYTRWSVVRNSKTLKYKWKPYDEEIPVEIDLNKIDFTKGTQHTPIPIELTMSSKAIDVTKLLHDPKATINFEVKI